MAGDARSVHCVTSFDLFVGIDYSGAQTPTARLSGLYPSIFRNRYERANRTPDEHDAYATARWLAESSAREILARYLDPPLTIHERAIAAREGWILGVC